MGRSHVGLVFNGEVAHYRGLQSCANVHCCPVDGPKIRAERMADVLTALEIHAARGGGLVFATNTLPHKLSDRLTTSLAMLLDAWTYISRQRGYQQWKQRVGLIGDIKALEVTCNMGGNGWHPHRHIIFLTDRPLSFEDVLAWEKALHEIYNRYLAKRGWTPSAVHVGIRLDYVHDPTGTGALARYMTKLQAAFELTRSDLKSARSVTGEMPFDLLERAISGDTGATRLWQEYETAMAGRSAIRFSKGLRAHLGMRRARTDQEIAEDDAGGQTKLYLTAPLYRRVFSHGDAAGLLRHLEAGGWSRVLAALWHRYRDMLDISDQPGLGLVIGIRGP